MRARTPEEKREQMFSLISISESTGCWDWHGYIMPRGYGQTSYKGRRSQYAHRVMYEILVGPIPDGLQLDHLCRNRACVNPAHLEPVTCRENLLRGETITARNAARSHCPHGHPYDAQNTRVSVDGSRVCRACDLRKYYAYGRERRQQRSLREAAKS